MRIAMVVTPFDESNLRLAAQIGVTDVVERFHGESLEQVQATKRQAEDFGLKFSVIEGYLPMQESVFGRSGRDEELEQMKTLIRSMGRAEVPTLCYNFMSKLDWTRTSFEDRGRGGALVNSFDIDKLEDEPPEDEGPRAEEFWANLEYFLERILPVAEEAGVRLAMHPDDPPGLPRLHGLPRIMASVEHFERLLSISSSRANAICFCQGCFAEMDVDIPELIHRFGPHIAFAHFRDVEGCTPRFRETFHDCGKTDMAAAMRAYHDIGFDGVIRPDHVPLLECEQGENTGYTMIGRLFAVGYMRGLMHAVESEES